MRGAVHITPKIKKRDRLDLERGHGLEVDAHNVYDGLIQGQFSKMRLYLRELRHIMPNGLWFVRN